MQFEDKTKKIPVRWIQPILPNWNWNITKPDHHLYNIAPHSSQIVQWTNLPHTNIVCTKATFWSLPIILPLYYPYHQGITIDQNPVGSERGEFFSYGETNCWWIFNVWIFTSSCAMVHPDWSREVKTSKFFWLRQLPWLENWEKRRRERSLTSKTTINC